MPANLTDNYVANTYQGVLHVNGQELPDDVKVQVYDGMGNKTAIQLGINSVDCQSLSAQGLTANDFKYPEEPGFAFNVLCQTTQNARGQVNTLELRDIKDIFCGSEVGLAAYTRSKNSVVPIVNIECGIVDDVDDVEITNITSAAGGIDKQETGNFVVSYVSLTGGLVKGLTLTPVFVTPQPNLLINAQGIINQRVIASGENLTAGYGGTWNPRKYFLDRWKSQSNVATWNYSSSSNSNIATINAAAGAVSQIIEKSNIIPGPYILSWKGNATATILERSSQYPAGSNRGSGSGGSGDVKSIAVQLLGGGDVEIRFTGGTFREPKFERGSIATEFDYRSFGSELLLCQRYFCKTYAYRDKPGEGAIGAIQSHTTEPVNDILHNNGWRFPVNLRTKIANSAWVFNPGNGDIDRFRYFQGRGGDRSGQFFDKAAEVAEWTDSGITHIKLKNPNDSLPEGTMRMFDTHYVADAEF